MVGWSPLSRSHDFGDFTLYSISQSFELHCVPYYCVGEAITETRGVSHTMALPFTLKSILRQKKNYKNPNISPYPIFKKPSNRNQNPSRDYYNSIIKNLKFQHKPNNIIFQKPSYKNRPVYLRTKIH
jgi:hypothetical protein